MIGLNPICLTVISMDPKMVDSGLAAVNFNILQGSVVGLLLFLLHINDVDQAITLYKIKHFADETNLLCVSNSIKKLSKLFNADLKHLVNWLNANKVSLNIKKPRNDNL